MQKNIFIFNPETDYALALGRARYNPPARIVALRKKLQLTHAKIASPGDVIVVDDDFKPEAFPDREAIAEIRKKGIITATLTDLPEIMSAATAHSLRIVPWGWNHSLRAHLQVNGIDDKLLKTNEQIDRIRQLSHRSTTIPFQKHLQDSLPHLNVPLAKEFHDLKEALIFSKQPGGVYFKAPWSSSGRGILYYQHNLSPVTSNISTEAKKANLSEKKLSEWISGFIRRQGSVMGERAFNRKADFATEWWIADANASFMGLSLFNTSSEGRYLGNSNLSQEDIDSFLCSISSDWTPKVIEAQKSALESLISSSYSGPVGIDMLIDTSGLLNPCVEINLRLTMGMIALGKPLPPV